MKKDILLNLSLSIFFHPVFFGDRTYRVRNVNEITRNFLNIKKNFF